MDGEGGNGGPGDKGKSGNSRSCVWEAVDLRGGN